MAPDTVCVRGLFFFSPGSPLGVASISDKRGGSPTGCLVKSLRPPQALTARQGIVSYVLSDGAIQDRSLGLVLRADTQRDEGELGGKRNAAREGNAAESEGGRYCEA